MALYCIGLSTEEDKVASVVSSTTVPASDQTPTCLQGNSYLFTVVLHKIYSH